MPMNRTWSCKRLEFRLADPAELLRMSNDHARSRRTSTWSAYKRGSMSCDFVAEGAEKSLSTDLVYRARNVTPRLPATSILKSLVPSATLELASFSTNAP